MDRLISILLLTSISSCLLSIVLSIFTARYFDALLDERKLPKPLGVGILPFQIMNRATLYVGYIMWNGPKKRRWKTYREQIGDFSFRTHARPIDYLLILSESITALCMLIIIILGAMK